MIAAEQKRLSREELNKAYFNSEGHQRVQRIIASNMPGLLEQHKRNVKNGLYDENGNRLVKGVPQDMRDDSGSNVGG